MKIKTCFIFQMLISFEGYCGHIWNRWSKHVKLCQISEDDPVNWESILKKNCAKRGYTESLKIIENKEKLTKTNKNQEEKKKKNKKHPKKPRKIKKNH